MSMTGPAFLVLMAVLTVVAIVVAVLSWSSLAGPGIRKILGRLGVIVLINLLVLLTAAIQLNDQYLFFAGWSDLQGAVTGNLTTTTLSRGGTASTAARNHVAGTAARAGTVLPPLPLNRMSANGVITFTIKGQASGLTGSVTVQLPPGYTSAGNSTRYPVMEAFQGYPGTTYQWISTMDLGGAMASAVASHQMRPALIVEPQTEFPRGTDTECVNGRPGLPQVETFVTVDVPNWVTHHFRVRTDRASWATIGLSAGGWCAAMSAMLHPAQYSAAIVMGGYFRPEFGPFYVPFVSTGPLDHRYDLIHLARHHPPSLAMWLETSHVDKVSYGSSAPFLKAARPPLALHAVVLQHAGHRISLWQQLLPSSLQWLGANVPGFR
ncbi:MAG: alpha/beta hydrolase [Nocardioides sp.]